MTEADGEPGMESRSKPIRLHYNLFEKHISTASGGRSSINPVKHFSYHSISNIIVQ